MIGCPLCGHGDRPPQVVSRGRLSARLDPDELCWDDTRIRGTHPAHGRMLVPLIRRGEARTGDLAMMLRDDVWSNAVAVHIHKIRVALERARLPVWIETVPRWGYRLVVESNEEKVAK